MRNGLSLLVSQQRSENYQRTAVSRSRNWRFTYVGGTDSSLGNEPESSEFADDGAFPASVAPLEQELEIVRWVGVERRRKQLTKIGLVPKPRVRILSRTAKGSVVLALPHRQIALNERLSGQLRVSLVSDK